MKILISMMLVVVVAFLVACGSSSATDTVQRAEFVALQQEVAALKADFTAFRDEAVTEIAALHEAFDALPVPRALVAGEPNPVPIAPFYPIAFTSADCQGPAYVDRLEFRRFAARHGFALRFTLRGQTDNTPETYGYIERGVEHTSDQTETALVMASRLDGPGSCHNDPATAHPQGLFVGWPVTMNTDDVEYERVTGVPVAGFLEGNIMGDTPIPSGADGVLQADAVDIWTSTGYLTRIRVEDSPATVR